jgi:predicted dehydrogenase
LAGARLGDERFDIYGSEGQLRLPDPYGADPLQVYLRRPWQALPGDAWTTLPAEPAPVFLRAVEAFAAAVQRGEPAPTGGRDARRVLAVVLAIYQSAVEGRAVSVQEAVTHA